MARFTKIPPVFSAQHAEQADDYPHNYELPDNVPPIMPDADADQSASASQNSDAHEGPDDMHDAEMDGSYTQPDIQPVPPAQNFADDYTEPDFADTSPDDHAAPASAAPQPQLRADDAAQEPPASDLPDHAYPDETGDIYAEHAPESQAEQDHDDAPDLPEQAEGHESSAGETPEDQEPDDETPEDQEPDDEYPEDQEPDLEYLEDQEPDLEYLEDQEPDLENQDDTEQDQSPESPDQVAEFTPTFGDEFLGLLIIKPEQNPQARDDDWDEDNSFDFFL